MLSNARRVWLPAALAFGVAGAGCSTVNDPADESSQIVVLGDSLAEQSVPYLHINTSDKELVPQFFGGTAPCDWLDEGVDASDESVVVITFTGNSATECMSDGSGGQLAGEALVDRYREDVEALIDEARDDGARVVLVGQPIRSDVVGDNDTVEALNAMYRDLASASFVSFVDAGAAVENADGSFTETLPCLPEEPECDPSGTNRVRSPDGLHFCDGACPEYSSGAYRFARAIVDAVQDPEQYE